MVLTQFLNGQRCYVITQRSRRGRIIFRDHKDFGFYFRLLNKYKHRFGIRIFAFCILPRSVYLILQPRDKKDLPAFVNTLKQGYRQYHAGKYQHNKKIWPGVFQCEPILTDLDLMQGIKAVEFSPVDAEISDNPISYPWSSCSYRVFNHKNGLLDPNPTQR